MCVCMCVCGVCMFICYLAFSFKTVQCMIFLRLHAISLVLLAVHFLLLHTGFGWDELNIFWGDLLSTESLIALL